MNKYLLNLQNKKRELNYSIKKEKYLLFQMFKFQYKYLFITMDILFVLGIIFNIGAVCLTNIMVVKEKAENNITFIFYETNPVAAKLDAYTIHPEKTTLINKFIIQIILWMISLVIWLTLRFNVYSKLTLIAFVTMTIFWFMFLAEDFFSDLGFYLGKIIFGL